MPCNPMAITFNTLRGSAFIMAVAEVSHRSVQALAVSVVHESTRIFSSTDMMACGTSPSAPHSSRPFPCRRGVASACLHEGKARAITLPMTQLPLAQRIEDGLPSIGQDPLFSKSEGAMPGVPPNLPALHRSLATWRQSSALSLSCRLVHTDLQSPLAVTAGMFGSFWDTVN